MKLAKKPNGSPALVSFLAKAITIHCWDAVLCACEFMKTDYSDVPNIKEGTILPILAQLPAGSEHDPPLRGRVAHAAARKLAHGPAADAQPLAMETFSTKF